MARIVLAAAALFLILVFFCAGQFWAVVLYHLLVDGALLVGWLAAAVGLGRPILKSITRKTPDDLFDFVSAAAIGLGVDSLAVLGLGLAGWLNRFMAIGLILVGLGILMWLVSRPKKTLAPRDLAVSNLNWLWLLAIPFAAIAFAGALCPPGLLWGDEPNGYDVVEYHLQVPRQWFELGRIEPLKENVFSYFPMGMEMHYLLAMELRGGPWAGMYLAQLMHAATCALAVAAACAAAGRTAGLLVALTPWVTLLAPVAYVEGGVLLYGTLAIAWIMRALKGGGNKDVILAGIMAGLACGVKITNLPMLVAIIALAMLAVGRLKQAIIFGAVAIALVSPWLIRTAVWAGNPVFPEAMSLLGRGPFSQLQQERWQRAYVPDAAHRSASGHLQALGEQFIWDWRYGWILLPAAIIAGAWRISDRTNRFLLIALGLLVIVWLACTHLQSRFLVLAIPICALLLADLKPPWSPAIIAVLFIAGIFPLGERWLDYLDKGGNRLFGIDSNLSEIRGVKIDAYPDNTRFDLVGDACAFWFQVPMTRLRYRTVFDVGPPAPSGSAVQQWLGGSEAPEAGRVIVISPGELQRLSRTYFGISPLTKQEYQNLADRSDVVIESAN
jgi:hypothetical protein